MALKSPRMKKRSLSATFLLVILLTEQCTAHVRLTYPPARTYALDFLDNVRTIGPCGMPEGETKTNLIEGSTLNVSWHLAYAHRGGILIDILEGGETKHWLTSGGNQFIGSDDTTATNEVVTLPDGYTCEGCTIRLLRQASEWGGGYRFWSCADVNIQPAADYSPACNRHGQYVNGKCECDHLFSGEQCQNEDECETDADCGNTNGVCVDIHSTTFPQRQCYCSPGWFGRNCEKQSALTSADFDPSNYQHQQLSDRYDLYYRILQEDQEIEVVMKTRGSNYVALGWRPSSYRSGCRAAFPEIDTGEGGNEPTPEGEGEPTPEGEGEHSPTPEGEREPTPEGEHEPTPTPEGEKEPTPEGEKEPTPEGEGEHTPTPEGEKEPTPEGEGEHTPTPEGEKEPTPEGEHEPTPTPEGEKEPTPEGEGEHTPTPEGEKEPTPEGEGEHTPTPEGEKEPTPEGEHEPTPTPEGEKEPTPESEGEHTPTPEGEKEPTPEGEHEPTPTPEGEKEPTPEGEGEHTPTPEGEKEPTPEGEGEPTSKPEAGGEWEANCDDSGVCDYRASWRCLSTEQVMFEVMAKQDINRWTGISFGRSTRMQEIDVVLGWVTDTGSSFVGDWWSGSYYSRPTVDGSQDISQTDASYVNGVLTISFVKPMFSEDDQDLSFKTSADGDTGNCLYFSYPVKGAAYNDGAQTISKHSQTPIVSSQCIDVYALCKEAMGKPEPTAEGEGEPTPTPEGEKEPPPEGEGEHTPTPEGEKEPTPEGEHEPTPTPEGEKEPTPEGEHEPTPTPEGEKEPTPEGEGEHTPTPEGEKEPTPEGEHEPTPTPEGEKEPTPEGEHEPTPTPEGEKEPTPEGEGEHTPTPEGEREPTPTPEGEKEPTPEGEGEPTPTPEGEKEPTPEGDHEPTPTPEGEKEPTPEGEGEHTPTPEGEHEPTPTPEGEKEPTPEGEHEPTPTPEGEKEPTPEGEGEPTPGDGVPTPDPNVPLEEQSRGEFHAMDCTDITVGTARDQYSRVRDYYTRDRSTPRMDQFFGGEDSLTAAVGKEENGETTIIFRKKLTSTERTDHSITDDLMHVIWARGQEHGEYNHRPNSGLETGAAKDKEFYKTDELKYHGHGLQRGVLSLNFHDAPDKAVSGEWKTPSSCTVDDCDYRATWQYDLPSEAVKFTVAAKQANSGWTGIGFSTRDSGRMLGSDVVIGWDDGASSRVVDGTLSAYSSPVWNAGRQGLTDSSVSYVDGTLYIEFTRPLRGDNGAVDLSGDAYFIFPVGGGGFDGASGSISKHGSTPAVGGPYNIAKDAAGEGTPEPSPEPEGTGEPAPEPEGTGEPTPEPEGTGEPEPEGTGEPKPEPEGTGEPSPETAATWEPEPEPTMPYSYELVLLPDGCTVEAETCQYKAGWYLDTTTDDIHFYVQAKQSTDRWTGIGFAKERSMKSMDVVLGFSDGGALNYIFDGWIDGLYNPPTVDSSQDISASQVTYNSDDGMINLEFKRPRQSADSNDVSFSDSADDCYYFVFPVGGGSYDPGSKAIGRHSSTPLFSKEKICVTASAAETTAAVPPTTTTTAATTTTSAPKVSVLVKSFIKLLVDWDDRYAQDSDEAKALKQKIYDDLIQNMGKIRGFVRFVVFALTRGSVVAELQTTVEVPEADAQSTKDDVQSVLDNEISDGDVAGLNADSGYAVVNEPIVGGGDSGSSGDDDDDGLDTNIIIVICVIIGLLLIVFIVALCKYCELRRKDGKHPPSSNDSDSSYRAHPERYHQPMPKSSFRDQEPMVRERPESFDNRKPSQKRKSSRKEPQPSQRAGDPMAEWDDPQRKVYSAPLQADVTLPRQGGGGGQYGVVIPNIGKKTQGPSYTQGVEGTVPSPNNQYSSLPLNGGNMGARNNAYSTSPSRGGPSQSSYNSLPSNNGSVYQRADGFTVYDPTAPGGGGGSGGPIIPQQADIYYPSSQSRGGQGQGYSNYETVSHIRVDP